MKLKAKAQKAMADKNFAELELSLKQALSYELGERQGSRVSEKIIPHPPRPRSKTVITNLRQSLHCSQSIFA